MIRTRLAVVFALVALLALAQSVSAWWAAASAADHAERSVIATRMLAEYLEIAGNKQRLKAWFAERMLVGEADPAIRDRLTAAMWASIEELRALAPLEPAPGISGEREDVELVALNVATLERALREAERPAAWTPPDEQWRSVILAFDELSGRDMRDLLGKAVHRHEAASLRESALLAEALERSRWANLGLSLGVLLLAVLAVIYFVRRLDRPFARLAALTGALASGDYGARSGLDGGDEFAKIGRLMDSLASRIGEAQARSAALQRQLDELVGERTRALTQAYESLLGVEARRRQFFAELSHELRTPVTVIRGEADLALRGRGDPTLQRDALRRISEAASELGGRTQDLLDAARGGSLEYAFTPRRWSMIDVVRPAVAQMQAVASHRGVALGLGEGAPVLEIEADRERLQQALVVVLDNALRYSPVGSSVRVAIESDDDAVLVHVDDEGPGMADEELERAFEPHYRGEAGRRLDPQGMGVGLAIVRRIVEAQGGSVELTPRAGGGLRVSFGLPPAGVATPTGATA
ncbi:MAG TPA: hypothetical protein DCM32_01170 [Xanthomonadaceae bacterium]|nr:hypothetical protein [Xanthomonadaceae bacterium]